MTVCRDEAEEPWAERRRHRREDASHISLPANLEVGRPPIVIVQEGLCFRGHDRLLIRLAREGNDRVEGVEAHERDERDQPVGFSAKELYAPVSLDASPGNVREDAFKQEALIGVRVGGCGRAVPDTSNHDERGPFEGVCLLARIVCTTRQLAPSSPIIWERQRNERSVTSENTQCIGLPWSSVPTSANSSPSS